MPLRSRRWAVVPTIGPRAGGSAAPQWIFGAPALPSNGWCDVSRMCPAGAVISGALMNGRLLQTLEYTRCRKRCANATTGMRARRWRSAIASDDTRLSQRCTRVQCDGSTGTDAPRSERVSRTAHHERTESAVLSSVGRTIWTVTAGASCWLSGGQVLSGRVKLQLLAAPTSTCATAKDFPAT